MGLLGWIHLYHPVAIYISLLMAGEVYFQSHKFDTFGANYFSKRICIAHQKLKIPKGPLPKGFSPNQLIGWVE